ncbi:MAG: DMT family transporter [Anaerolineae bacterium]
MKHMAFWIATASALLFGAATPISKTLLTDLTPYQLAGILYLGACLGVLVPVIREGRLLAPWRMDRRNALCLLGAVILGGMLGPLMLMGGLRLASASSVSMWLNLELVATAVLGHLVFRDHLTPQSWLAVAGILFAAVILAAGEGLAGVEAGLLVAIACLCWGADNHLTAIIDGITPAQSTFWKGLVAGSTNLIIGVSLAPLPEPAWGVVGGLIVGAFSYGLSITLYVTAAQQMGATRSQLIFSSAPLWGLLISVLVFGEAFTARHALAAVLFGISTGLLVREKHRHHHVHCAQQHEHPHTHDDGHHDHAKTPGWHTHAHRHNGIPHAHPHWPDLHHRHTHASEDC